MIFRYGQRIPTNQWTKEDTQVAGEREEAESPGLGLLCADLTQHGSYGDDRTRKDSSDTSEQYHLP
jgi:hypothetical protein